MDVYFFVYLSAFVSASQAHYAARDAFHSTASTALHLTEAHFAVHVKSDVYLSLYVNLFLFASFL